MNLTGSKVRYENSYVKTWERLKGGKEGVNGVVIF